MLLVKVVSREPCLGIKMSFDISDMVTILCYFSLAIGLVLSPGTLW